MKNIKSNQKGASLTEYALILMGIALVALVPVKEMGLGVNNHYVCFSGNVDGGGSCSTTGYEDMQDIWNGDDSGHHGANCNGANDC